MAKKTIKATKTSTSKKPAAKPAAKTVKAGPPKMDKKRCQRCNKFNPIDDTICNWCEKPVVKGKAAPVPAKAEKPAPKSKSPTPKAAPVKVNPVVLQANRAVAEKWKCEYCGTWNGLPGNCRKCSTPKVKSDAVKTAHSPAVISYMAEKYPPPAAPVKPTGGQHTAPRTTEEEYNRLFDARKAAPAAAPPAAKPEPVIVIPPPPPVLGAAATAPHLFIIARAGCGKTTTLIGGTQKAQGITPRDAFGMPMVPSDQQKAVWDSLALSRGVRSIGLTSFSNTIVDELKERVKGTTVNAFTLHSYGWAAARKAVRGLQLVKEGLYKFMLADILGRRLDADLYKEMGTTIEAVNALVGHCKMNLTDPTPANLEELASHYEVDLPDRCRADVFNYVPAILRQCKEVKAGGRVSFHDMIWLPVVLGLPVPKYDLLMVDEAQDLNRCQHALARMAVGDTGRLVFCGDPRQAIFGFAGADAKSMERLTVELGTTGRGVQTLKLTKTRRCGKAIVEEARKVVDDFEAFESNPTGVVREMGFAEGPQNYRAACRAGDMVLCRVNAPLISQCFKFLREGKTAVMLGRKVGEGLVKLIDKLDPVSVVDLIQKLDDWHKKESDKENARRIPNENKLINLTDTRDCLICFTEGVETVEEMKRKIDAMFTDDRRAEAVRLASIHKSKGLEARRVFFINTEKAPCPHPMAKSDWAIEQEYNLLYVGTTRAIDELVKVA